MPILHTGRPLLALALGFLLFALLAPPSARAQDANAARVLALINQARLNAGLVPLAVNPTLTAAAQAHADDMARNGTGIAHTGSDGSTPATRMVRAGYHAYSWGPLVGENWAAYQTVDVSMNWWMSDAAHRSNILRSDYREIGVGASLSSTGDPILVTDFGAQPNVLPVFVTGTGAAVVLTLSNEDAAPAGDGPNVIGRAVRVDISTHSDLSQARTFPFARSIQYASPDGQRITSVYVRFTDEQGRSTVSTGIGSNLNIAVAPAAVKANAPVTPTRTRAPRPSPTRSATPRPPTATFTATATPTNTSTPTATPTATETLRLRQAMAVPLAREESVEAMTADSSLPSLAQALFGATALVSMLALAAALRLRGK